MISKRTKYGLKALIYLAREYEKGPVLIGDLARDENIPKKFLEAILLALKNNGMLQSKKGKGGGYYLGRNPKSITVGQAIRVMEGQLALVPCASETAYARCTECESEYTCGVRIVMKEVHGAMALILDGTTLTDVLDKIENAKDIENGTLNFCI